MGCLYVYHHPWWTPKNLWRNHWLGQRKAVADELQRQRKDDTTLFDSGIAHLEWVLKMRGHHTEVDPNEKNFFDDLVYNKERQ